MSTTKKGKITTNDFLRIDLTRKRLAQLKQFDNFVKTYSENKNQQKNGNTNKFWNTKFEKPENLNEQDAMTREKIKRLIEYLPKRKARILDLGIGQGYLEQKLKELGIKHEIHGVDISKTAIDRARKKFNGKFTVTDILKIDNLYPANSFDVIIAIEVIEHISPNDIFTLYRKIYTLLRRNGTFIVSTPINEGLLYKKVNPSNHVRDYSEPILRTEFMLANFQITKMQSLFAFSNFYSLKKTLTLFFPNRWKPNNIQIKAVKI